MIIFEWDEEKERENRRKHSVSFKEAETVFYDPHVITIHDPDHSDDEHRFVDIGFSGNNRLLVVVYTERGERTRIISVRKANRSEIESYDKV